MKILRRILSLGQYSFLPIAISLSLFAISSCTVNKAKIDNNLKKYFDAEQVEGCFTMLNNSDGKVTVYNMELDTMRFLPASTFDIIGTLISLQTGVAADENMVIKWDGVIRPNSNWNKDLTLTQAFKSNSLPHFQEIARRIGKDTLKQWVDSLAYGNRNVSGPVDSFWQNNTLKISPDEQLGLLKRIYFDQLPFRKSVHQSVRDLMQQVDNTQYKLSYHTGLGIDQNNNSIGWLAGWIEENRHVYFFVSLVKSKNPTKDMATARMNITQNILKELGFLQGKM
jgi:beta-lactamase class D